MDQFVITGKYIHYCRYSSIEAVVLLVLRSVAAPLLTFLGLL